MSPCQLWQADPRSACNGVRDTSSSCTYRLSLTFGIHICHLGFSLDVCHGIVLRIREMARMHSTIFFVYNWTGEQGIPVWAEGRKQPLCSVQGGKMWKDYEVFSASILVELIKVFLAGRKMQMLTKSMRPAAKSTDTSEQIWLISQTGSTSRYTHVCTRFHTHTNLWYTMSLWPSCSIWSRAGQRK